MRQSKTAGSPDKKLAAQDTLVGSYWTPFDTIFEDSIAALVSPERDYATLKQRNELLDWYGKYLFRLVAMSRGWPAHITLINTWQEAWVEAKVTKRLPRKIERALRDFVLPPSSDGEESFFPILKSRVDILSEGGTALAVGIPRSDFKIRVRTVGDSMILSLHDVADGASISAETVLDFHMTREALAKNGGSGFTDSLSVIEPRVERIRASLLSSQVGKRWNGAALPCQSSGSRHRIHSIRNATAMPATEYVVLRAQPA